MAKFAFDTSELRALAADMSAVPARLNRHLFPVVKRGANNIRSDMRDAMAASKSFGEMERHITYDVERKPGAIEAEIGPKKTSGGASRGLGFGANIAYFGTPRGGGGTVEDPQKALDREAPKFEQALGDAAEGLLDE